MTRAMSRCGSIDPDHVARRCKACKAVYNKRWASQGPVLQRIHRNPAACVFCGIWQGNDAGVKVLRYPLLRHWDKGGRHTSFTIGSMPMCDRCVMEHGTIKDEFRYAKPGLRDGLRANSGEPVRLAS